MRTYPMTLIAASLLTSLLMAAAPAKASDLRVGLQLGGGVPSYDISHRGRGYDDGRGRRDTIDERQDRQRWLIEQGLRHGSITPREAQRLLSEQHEIERLERRLASDGRLTPRERARLHEELNDARRNIQYQARDDDRWSYHRGDHWR